MASGRGERGKGAKESTVSLRLSYLARGMVSRDSRRLARLI